MLFSRFLRLVEFTRFRVVDHTYQARSVARERHRPKAHVSVVNDEASLSVTHPPLVGKDDRAVAWSRLVHILHVAADESLRRITEEGWACQILTRISCRIE